MGVIRLSDRQIETRDVFKRKVEQKEYQLKSTVCFCGFSNDIVLAVKDRYDIPLRTVFCFNCGLVRSNPYYTDETLMSFYNNEYRALYSSSNYATKDFFREQEVFGHSIISFLSKNIDLDLNKKKVYEVGCGAGGILMAFKESGADVIGCDYGDEYLSEGKSRGLHLVTGGSDKLEKYGKANLIVMNHVVEHFTNIDEEMKRISKLLEKGGFLYVGVPGLFNHVNSYGSLHWYLQNAHFYSFSLSSLTTLVESFGFEFVAGNEKIQAVFRKVPYTAKESRKSSFITRLFTLLFLLSSSRWGFFFEIYHKSAVFLRSIIKLVRNRK